MIKLITITPEFWNDVEALGQSSLHETIPILNEANDVAMTTTTVGRNDLFIMNERGSLFFLKAPCQSTRSKRLPFTYTIIHLLMVYVKYLVG